MLGKVCFLYTKLKPQLKAALSGSWGKIPFVCLYPKGEKMIQADF